MTGLVRANATVYRLTKVAVHAQHLKSRRVAMLLGPYENPAAVPLAISIRSTKFAPVLGAVVEDVVNGQELRFSLSTACAFVSAIRHDRFVPDLLPVVSAALSL